MHLRGWRIPDVLLAQGGALQVVRPLEFPLQRHYREANREWPNMCDERVWQAMKYGEDYEHLLPLSIVTL